ncbi:MAG TPA: zinc-binding alcohol dehydrogenase family protein [Gaiellaceae bacterium]|nr:zinc-binding alcohol dehydrogenase family protein [Gaiellaceae bacterium]
MIRAARVVESGRPPQLGDVAEPPGEGDVVVDVSAFALNPIDVNVALGRFYGGTPPLPYVAGVEAVGRDESGRRVYLNGPGIGIARDGVWAERVRVPAAAAHEIPPDAPDEVALACGVAGLAGWIPITWRLDVRADDRVLVLGATGSVGRVAVQAAKLRGAHVVAAGRRRDALEGLGADEIVELGRDELPDGATVIFDGLWGEPIAAALARAAPGVRVANVGQSAGAEATIPSNSVRGKRAEIYGYSNYTVPPDVYERGYRELVERAVAGDVRLDAVETYDLDALDEAWERQARGPGAKLVVRFS